MPKLHINDNGVWKAIDAGNTDQLGGKTKTEVLQEAANLAGSAGVGSPNILINTDVLHVVNQRAFNGNWGSAAVGSYGYDRWLKADAVNKGQIVESGNFVPGATYTLGYSVANVRSYTQLTAPTSGHWLVKVPFTADKFDLYLGTVERPWVPEGKVASYLNSARYYYARLTYSDYAYSIALTRPFRSITIPYAVRMRQTPTVNYSVGGTLAGTNPQVARINQDGAYFEWTIADGAAYASILSFKADAELTLGDL